MPPPTAASTTHSFALVAKLQRHLETAYSVSISLKEAEVVLKDWADYFYLVNNLSPPEKTDL